MPSIESRQFDASPEIEFNEIYIPDDSNLGTGKFTTLVKSGALHKSRAISSIIINPPLFQISVTINPGSREIPVLIGIADGSEPIFMKTFILPADIDTTIKYRFIARFEDWRIISFEMNGDKLIEKGVL